jgi:hypothetical protein
MLHLAYSEELQVYSVYNDNESVRFLTIYHAYVVLRVELALQAMFDVTARLPRA